MEDPRRVFVDNSEGEASNSLERQTDLDAVDELMVLLGDIRKNELHTIPMPE